jgi:hypothetical protein
MKKYHHTYLEMTVQHGQLMIYIDSEEYRVKAIRKTVFSEFAYINKDGKAVFSFYLIYN